MSLAEPHRLYVPDHIDWRWDRIQMSYFLHCNECGVEVQRACFPDRTGASGASQWGNTHVCAVAAPEYQCIWCGDLFTDRDEYLAHAYHELHAPAHEAQR